jgi:putative dimethyl sulfoxide reductase chaperone
LNNADEAERRGRAALLDLLADLLLHELEMPKALALAADPALAAALDPPRDKASLRELRAVYARLFLIDVPPYASVYLDVPPVIGGATSVEWERFLAAQGQPLLSLERAAAPDHAGLLLRALAAAERAGASGSAGRVLRQTLQGLPQALTAIGRNDAAGFYMRVADLAAHALQACAAAAVWEPSGITADALPEPEDDSLREVARWLCTPALSGWFLSRHALRQLARPFGVAIGFVDREGMLEQVFEASALDHRTGELLDALLAEWHGWQAALLTWRRELGAWAGALDHWNARLQRTHTTLDGMRAALLASG